MRGSFLARDPRALQSENLASPIGSLEAPIGPRRGLLAFSPRKFALDWSLSRYGTVPRFRPCARCVCSGSEACSVASAPGQVFVHVGVVHRPDYSYLSASRFASPPGFRTKRFASCVLAANSGLLLVGVGSAGTDRCSGFARSAAEDGTGEQNFVRYRR